MGGVEDSRWKRKRKRKRQEGKRTNLAVSTKSNKSPHPTAWPCSIILVGEVEMYVRHDIVFFYILLTSSNKQEPKEPLSGWMSEGGSDSR